jgi:hypothetical protein
VFLRCKSSTSGSSKAKLLTVLFSHGNGEDIGLLLEELAEFSQRVAANVLVYEYEGYGTSRLEGRVPSEVRSRKAHPCK